MRAAPYPQGDIVPEPVPIYGTNRYVSLYGPVSLNNNGTVSFGALAYLAGYQGIFTDTGSGGRIVAMEQLYGPATGGFYDLFGLNPSRFSLNDAGQVAFQGTTEFSVFRGILLDTSGPDNVVARAGQTAPSTGGGVFYFGSGYIPDPKLDPALNNLGQVAFSAAVSGGTTTGGVFLNTGGVNAAISVQGETSPETSGGTYATFNAPSLNDSGVTAFRATVAGGSATEGLFRASGATDTAVALQGETAPGTGGGTYASFGAPMINNAGAVGFKANVAGGTAGQGLFIDSGGVDTVFALQGQAAPGTGGGTLNAFGDPSLNDSGSAAFKASVTGGSSSGGIFVFVPGSTAIYAVALLGQYAPGLGAITFTALSDPSLNDLRQIAFSAHLSDGSDGNFLATPSLPEPSSLLLLALGGAALAARRRAWSFALRFIPFAFACSLVLIALPLPARAQAYSWSLLAKSGDAVPGVVPIYGNETYVTLSGPICLNNQGTVSFGALIADSYYGGIFTDTGPGGRIIAVQQLYGPSDIGGYYPNSPIPGPASLNDAGQVAFLSSLMSLTSTGGIFLDANGPDSTIVSQGEIAPSTGGGSFSIQSLPSLNSAGQVGFRSSISGGAVTDGVFLHSGNTDTALSLQGDAAPGTGGGTYASFFQPWLNDSGATAFRAIVSGGTAAEGLFLASGTTDTAVALQGEAVTGTGGGAYASFGNTVLSNTGAVAFKAGVTGGTAGQGLFIDAGGVDMVVALQGQQAPGTNGGVFNTFGDPSLNDSGVVAFTSTVIGGSSASGIFVYDLSSGRLTAVALSSQIAPGSGGLTFSSFSDPSLNDLGQVAFIARSSLIYLTTPIPEPSSLLLLGLGGAVLAARRGVHGSSQA